VTCCQDGPNTQFEAVQTAGHSQTSQIAAGRTRFVPGSGRQASLDHDGVRVEVEPGPSFRKYQRQHLAQRIADLQHHGRPVRIEPGGEPAGMAAPARAKAQCVPQ